MTATQIHLGQISQEGADDGQVLTWDDAAVKWVPADPAGASYTDPLTTKGDLVGRSSSATVRVPVGTNGYALVADSTATPGVAWADLGGLYVPKSLADAKGDLFTATANDTPARLAVGSNGQVLSADSGETTGLKWIAALTDPSTTKGDLLVRGASAIGRRAVGSDGQVLTADSAQTDGVKWATPSAGSAGGDPIVTKHNTGNISVTAATWADFDTGTDITLAAATGDWIEVEPLGLWNSTGAVFGYMDVVTIVSAAVVNSVVKGSAPTNSDFGSYAWSGLTSVFSKIAGKMSYQVQAGDISGGNVLLRVRVRLSSASTKSIFGSSTEIFVFQARNLG